MAATQNNSQLFPRKKCMIWRRVSTLEQELSLEAQTQACYNLAKELGFNEIIINPPVSESAKEAGEAFKKMLKRVKDTRQGFDGIIIEYADRLSRNLPIGGHEIRDLRKRGIYLYSVSERLNTENMEDIFRADGYLSSAERENYIRTQKTRNGTIHWLKEGYHMGKPPIGYERRTGFPKNDNRSKELILTEDAPLISEAFRLLNSGVQIKVIQSIISSKGLDVSTKRWGEILRNPIYMGVIKNKALNEEQIEAKHDPIISKRTFETAQLILSKNKKEKSTDEVDDILLKGNLRCCKCGNEMTAYEKRKNKKTYYYYKCYSKGCSNNISSKTVNDAFKDNLSKLKFNKEIKDHFKNLISNLYEETFAFEIKVAAKKREEITKLHNRIQRCEDEYYDDIISREKKDEKVSQWQSKIKHLSNELNDIMVISKDDFIKTILTELDDFGDLFESLTYQEKKQILPLLHESISFNKESKSLSTDGLISLFSVA